MLTGSDYKTPQVDLCQDSYKIYISVILPDLNYCDECIILGRGSIIIEKIGPITLQLKMQKEIM